MNLLVFHSLEETKAMHQCNGMITARLFPFGSSDTEMKLGSGKTHSFMSSSHGILINTLNDIVCLFNTGLFKEGIKLFNFECILSAGLCLSVQARKSISCLIRALYCSSNPL